MSLHLAVDTVSRDLSPEWRVEPLRRVAWERGARNSRLTEPPLSLSSSGDLYERTVETDRQFASEQSARHGWVVHPGDLVVNPMWLSGGAIGVSDRRGAVSPDYRVYELSRRIHPRYLHHLVRSNAYRDQYRLYMRAETTFDRRVTKDDFNEMPVIIPPLPAQKVIADFLDRETNRIDALVAIRRRQLELLSERRRLTTDRILQSVASGQNWPIVSLKHVVHGFIDTLHSTAPEEDDGPGFIVGTACIKDGSLNLAQARRCSRATLNEWTRRAVPRAGDLLLTREAPAGEAAIVPDDVPLAPGQRVVLVQTDATRMLPELVLYSVYSARARDFFSLLGRETTVSHLNMADIGALPVVLPPYLGQPEVIDKIREVLGATDQAASGLVAQIDLLRERRNALVMAAITGQVDTAGVAA